MNTILVKLTEEYTDDYPVVMIDVSGSTSGKIITKEKKITHKILSNKGIDGCNLICWSTNKSHVYPDTKVGDIANFNMSKEQFGGTDLSEAFHLMPKEWYEKKKCLEIYVVTDGEMNSDNYNLKKQMNDLIVGNLDIRIKIHVIAVENNRNDYNNLDNLEAGNEFYKLLQEQKLMSNISSFVTYNDNHVAAPFINICKYDVPPGFIPFRDVCFNITNTNKFIRYLRDEIMLIKNDSNKLDRLAHELAYTIHKLLVEKSDKIQYDIIDMFCKLFVGAKNYDDICKSLTQEILRHQKGTSSSYLDYRSRKNLINITQMNLYKNTLKGISYNKYSKYLTYPVKSDNGEYIMYKVNKKKVNGDVRMRDKIFNCGGCTIGKYTLPVLPLIVNINNEVINQCVRQYIRAIMGNQFNLYPGDDTILYLFLSLMLKVYLSDIDVEVKTSFVELGRVMLDRHRFQTDVKEITYLLDGNPPSPVLYNNHKMDSILSYCVKALDFGNIKPYTLWYGIIIALGKPLLKINQWKYCKNDIKKDFPNVNIKNIASELPKLLKKDVFSVITVDNNILDDIEYTCYLSLDDTSKSGGYKFLPHEIASGIMCIPRYVIAPRMIDNINTKYNGDIMCPICYTYFKTTELKKIHSKKQVEDNMKKQDIEIHNLNTTLFDNDKHAVIDTIKLMNVSNKLYDLDTLNFSVASYQFNGGLVVNHNTSQKVIMRKSNKEFVDESNIKHRFLSMIDMKNVCVAGGYCRSILLSDNTKDIDMFLYGLDDDAYYPRVCKLINDIVIYMKATIKNLVFVIMYKENTHILDLLCLEYIGSKRMKSHDTQDILHKNKDKYKSHCKIHIILLKNKNMVSLLNTFDLPASQVAYVDGTVYMTEMGYNAYKYMINIVDDNKHTNLFSARLRKHYKNGFAILFPKHNLSEQPLLNGLYTIKCNDDEYRITSMITHNNIITAIGIDCVPGKNTVETYISRHKMSTSSDGDTNVIGTTGKYIRMINLDIPFLGSNIDKKASITHMDPELMEQLYNVVFGDGKNRKSSALRKKITHYKVWAESNDDSTEDEESDDEESDYSSDDEESDDDYYTIKKRAVRKRAVRKTKQDYLSSGEEDDCSNADFKLINTFKC